MRIKPNLDNLSDKFNFRKVYEKDIKPEIINLNSEKNCMNHRIV